MHDSFHSKGEKLTWQPLGRGPGLQIVFELVRSAEFHSRQPHGVISPVAKPTGYAMFLSAAHNISYA